MISNYLKIVFRLIGRQKSFAFINIFGLTIGLIGFILIFLFVRYELSFDTHHKKVNRVYQIVRDVYYDEKTYNFLPVPYPFRDAIASEYPEIEKATRFDFKQFMFRFEDKVFDEPVLIADTDVFDMFTFPLLEGNPGKPLPDGASVAISKSIAEKYFGDASALGKELLINNEFSVTVSAVYENPPPNASLKNNIILPFDFYKTLGMDLSRWNENMTVVYLLLQEGTDIKAFEAKLKPRLAKNQPSDKPDDLFLHPYKDLYLHPYHYKSGGPIMYVYIFSAIGIVILSLAAINYVNLVTARSVRRAKEIGIRKTAGAQKTQIVFQFLSESVLFAIISLNFAVLSVELMLPLLNPLIGKNLQIEYSNPFILLSLIGIAIFAGLLAGSYPAFYLSRFSPATVLKNAAKLRGSNFKSVLVIIQFSVSIALIITSIILYQQFDYLRKLPVGFSKENVFYFKLETEPSQQFDALRKEFSELPGVVSVAKSSHLPLEIGSNGGGFSWEGKSPDQDVLIGFTQVDEGYLKTFNMELTEGRFYTAGEIVQDTANKIAKVVVNEKLVEVANFKDPIGKFLTRSYRYEIIGVVKNFNFLGMQAEVAPLMMHYKPSTAGFGFVRVSGNPKEIKEQLNDRYAKLFPQYPPNFILLDDRFNQYFNRESRNAGIFGYFTMLAIVISCLGLYGLASFIAEQRKKEMGIRKALGASTTTLSLLMLKGFAIWIVISNAIAIPVAWWYSESWLSKYTFRTEISLWIFGGAIIISALIAFLTVLLQVLKTAKQNPATVLKYE